LSASAILLVAHGARDPRWAAPIERLADALARRVDGSPVRIAYLEFLHPGIPEALEALRQQGARRVRVVPVFLGAGGHVVGDVAERIAAARILRPDLEIALEPPVGDRQEVTEAIASVIAFLKHRRRSVPAQLRQPVLHLAAGSLSPAQPEGQGNRHRHRAEREAEGEVDDVVGDAHGAQAHGDD
jgi:sirohydrochlorin cobaltochelatase